MVTLNEIAFFGFSDTELAKIRKGTGRSPEDDFDYDFVQQVADIMCVEIGVAFQPDAQIILIKGA